MHLPLRHFLDRLENSQHYNDDRGAEEGGKRVEVHHTPAEMPFWNGREAFARGGRVLRTLIELLTKAYVLQQKSISMLRNASKRRHPLTSS